MAFGETRVAPHQIFIRKFLGGGEGKTNGIIFFAKIMRRQLARSVNDRRKFDEREEEDETSSRRS